MAQWGGKRRSSGPATNQEAGAYREKDESPPAGGEGAGVPAGPAGQVCSLRRLRPGKGPVRRAPPWHSITDWSPRPTLCPPSLHLLCCGRFQLLCDLLLATWSTETPQVVFHHPHVDAVCAAWSQSPRGSQVQFALQLGPHTWFCFFLSLSRAMPQGLHVPRTRWAPPQASAPRGQNASVPSTLGTSSVRQSKATLSRMLGPHPAHWDLADGSSDGGRGKSPRVPPPSPQVPFDPLPSFLPLICRTVQSEEDIIPGQLETP